MDQELWVGGLYCYKVARNLYVQDLQMLEGRQRPPERLSLADDHLEPIQTCQGYFLQQHYSLSMTQKQGRSEDWLQAEDASGEHHGKVCLFVHDGMGISAFTSCID